MYVSTFITLYLYSHRTMCSWQYRRRLVCTVCRQGPKNY